MLEGPCMKGERSHMQTPIDSVRLLVIAMEDVNEKYRFPVHIAIILIESISCSG